MAQSPCAGTREGKGEAPDGKEEQQGNPAGGVIFPLLANLYLHWFEIVFNRKVEREGLQAGRVRYADDFVILTRERLHGLIEFVEDKLETWMELTINTEKTSQKNLRIVGTRLAFLGYSFRYDKDLNGYPWRYLNVFPSPKSLQRERAALRRRTDKRHYFKPVPELLRELNRHLRGWANYYGYGYPRKAFRDMNCFF